MTTTALKNTNVKRHVLNMSALTTCFGSCKPLVNLTNMLASFHCHPFQDVEKAVKGKVRNLPSPQSLHPAQVQRFEIHSVKSVAQSMSQFEEPISSSVGDSFIRFAQSMFRLFAILTAFLFSCQFSVASGDFSQTSFEELRTIDSSTVAANQECFESKIKPCRVSGASGLRYELFLNATKHYPQLPHRIPLEIDGLDRTLYFARFDEFVLILAKTNFVSAKIGPASLCECDAASTSRFAELRCSVFSSSSILNPLEERLIRQVKFFDNALNTLRTDNLPVSTAFANFGNMLHQRKLVAMLFEQSVVVFLECNTVIPNTSRHRHYPVKAVALTALVHSESVADSHLYVFLIFDILLDYQNRCAANCGDKITVSPKRWESALEVREFTSKNSTASAFNLFDKSMYPILRVALDKQMNMVRHCFDFDYVAPHIVTNILNDLFQPRFHRINKHIPAVFWTPHDMVLTRIADIIIGFISHREIIQLVAE